MADKKFTWEKKIDGTLFVENYRKWVNREITRGEFAEAVGLSIKTLDKRLLTLMTTGKLQCFYGKDETVELGPKRDI